MRAGLVLLLGLSLGGLPAARGGEGLSSFTPTSSPKAPLGYQPVLIGRPDTSRKVLRPDSVVAPVASTTVGADLDQPTRKTSLRIVVAIAILTVTTLLLYNVRSR